MLALIVLLQSLVVAVSGPPTSTEYLPLHLAAAEGYLRREGLDVTLRPTRSEVAAAEALARGETDLAATSLEAILRFAVRPGDRPPQLVFALTAAPPVALLVPAERPAAGGLPALAGRRVGVSAPGAPEVAWLGALLARAGLRPTDIELTSLGPLGVVAALERGGVDAALVEEPHARRLLADGRARLVADLRSPEAAARSVGQATVNAALFLRAERRVPDGTLAALARALLAAGRRLATAGAEELGRTLPPAIVGLPEEFALRLETARGLYLPEGRVTVPQVAHTVALIDARLALGAAGRTARPRDLLRLVPLTPPAPAPRR